MTYNTRDFPARLLADTGVQAWHPDTLLCTVLHHRPVELRRIVTDQGGQMHPPRPLVQMLDRLAQDVPQFVAEARLAFDR